MILNKVHKILWFTIVTLLTFTNAITSITRMKALVLYAQNSIPTITNALDSYGIDYYELDVTTLKSDDSITSLLYDDGKRPLYYMIIVDNNLEIYNSNQNEWESVLSSSQWEELENYEAHNHVRRVVVNNFPRPIKIDNKWGGYTKKQLEIQSIVTADNDWTKKIFNDARIKVTAPLTSKGLIHSNIEDSDDENVIPILYFNPTENVPEKTLAAAIFKKENNREVLSFFLYFSPNSLTVTILNHLWITWASRGLITGYRKVLFIPQIENVFLSTKVVNENLNPNDSLSFEKILTNNYRATVNDFKNIIEFSNNITKNNELNLGSDFKIELLFNGNGILESSEDPSYNTNLNNKRNMIVTMDRKTEKEILVEEINKYWNSRHEEMEKDELFKFFTDINTRKEFNWVSNTFSNKILLNATHREIVDEVVNNLEVAMHLGLISKNLQNSEVWWSKESIGTRGSLGFTDDTVTDIFKKYSISYGLGNKLRKDIVNEESEYNLWINNKKDFYVLPRNKRLVLRWASSPKQSVWLYQKYNEKELKQAEKYNSKNYVRRSNTDNINEDLIKKVTQWYDILDIESEQAVQSLLQLKHEPFVFNQANIRVNHKTRNNSIMAQWIQATIRKFNSYVYWPMTSPKSDHLASYFTMRENKKECNPEISYSHNDTHILGIYVSSYKSCKVPIIVSENVKRNKEDNDISYEANGVEPLTVWINLPGDGITKSIEFDPPISFNDKTIIHFSGEDIYETDGIDNNNIEIDNNISNDDLQSNQQSKDNADIKNLMESILTKKIKREDEDEPVEEMDNPFDTVSLDEILSEIIEEAEDGNLPPVENTNEENPIDDGEEGNDENDIITETDEQTEMNLETSNNDNNNNNNDNSSDVIEHGDTTTETVSQDDKYQDYRVLVEYLLLDQDIPESERIKNVNILINSFQDILEEMRSSTKSPNNIPTINDILNNISLSSDSSSISSSSHSPPSPPTPLPYIPPPPSTPHFPHQSTSSSTKSSSEKTVPIPPPSLPAPLSNYGHPHPFHHTQEKQENDKENKKENDENIKTENGGIINSYWIDHLISDKLKYIFGNKENGNIKEVGEIGELSENPAGQQDMQNESENYNGNGGMVNSYWIDHLISDKLKYIFGNNENNKFEGEDGEDEEDVEDEEDGEEGEENEDEDEDEEDEEYEENEIYYSNSNWLTDGISNKFKNLYKFIFPGEVNININIDDPIHNKNDKKNELEE